MTQGELFQFIRDGHMLVALIYDELEGSMLLRRLYPGGVTKEQDAEIVNAVREFQGELALSIRRHDVLVCGHGAAHAGHHTSGEVFGIAYTRCEECVRWRVLEARTPSVGARLRF